MNESKFNRRAEESRAWQLTHEEFDYPTIEEFRTLADTVLGEKNTNNQSELSSDFNLEPGSDEVRGDTSRRYATLIVGHIEGSELPVIRIIVREIFDLSSQGYILTTNFTLNEYNQPSFSLEINCAGSDTVTYDGTLQDNDTESASLDYNRSLGAGWELLNEIALLNSSQHNH